MDFKNKNFSNGSSFAAFPSVENILTFSCNRSDAFCVVKAQNGSEIDAYFWEQRDKEKCPIKLNNEKLAAGGSHRFSLECNSQSSNGTMEAVYHLVYFGKIFKF